jgi:glycosyltransferase involved in cell wall biosynthesis
MALTIVSVACPLVPAGYDSVGGSEQILSLLDEALVAQGHRSIVVGCEGSSVAGMLVPTPAHTGPADAAALERGALVQQETLQRLLDTVDVDVVHMHGANRHTQLPEPGPPVLVTLHLPPFHYAEGVRNTDRPQTFFNCVSHFSRRLYPTDTPLSVIPNGVPLDRFRPGPPKENFVIALGRICREKGFHVALEAAKKAGLPMMLGGRVPPMPEHQRYFEEEILPRLDDERRFLGTVPLAERIDLLARARCAVIPSLVDESASLVAIEALACGTPVVARPVGALPENIEHGRTGLFAYAVEDMARAFLDAGRLDPRECRLVACQRFSASRMVQSYLGMYERLASLRKDSDVPPRAPRLPGSAAFDRA